jgi:tetratricopeptide (TPR) repeat protein
LITGNLGDVAWRCGDLQEAETWLIESLALAEQITDRDGICWCLATLAMIQNDLGKTRDALEKIRRALVTAHRMHNTVRLGFALAVLADWRITQVLVRSHLETMSLAKIAASVEGGRLLHAARAAAERTLALEDIDSETRGIGQAALAQVYLLQGNLDLAQQLALTALEEARQNEAIHLIGRSQRLLGEVQASRGQAQEAEQSFEQAIQVFKQHGLRLERARTLQRYGASLLEHNWQTSLDQGRDVSSFTGASSDQRGRDYLREARSLFETCQASVVHFMGK